MLLGWCQTSHFANPQTLGNIESFMAEPRDELSTDPLLIYPYPSEGHFILSYTSEVHENIVIALYDLMGKRIQELYRGNVLEGKNNIPLESHSIPSGVYSIKVQGDSISERVSITIR